jgi:ribosomal protein S18 acetylase RimI-like enzyme
MNNPTDDIAIIEITKATKEIYRVMIKLLSQLTSSKLSFSQKDLKRIVTSKNSILFAAVDKEINTKIFGILTLVLIEIPTSTLARIEDVVVDKSARGKGIGETITLAAIQRARELGITKIDLTSSPSRKLANRLYQRLGFKQRTTNVYRYEN